MTISCAYDGESNSTSVSLSKIEQFGVTFPLSNQAPFIMWDSPSDQTIFPSQSEVSFNASRSWDLDDDFMTFTWTSSIDGQLLQGLESEFTANG